MSACPAKEQIWSFTSSCCYDSKMVIAVDAEGRGYEVPSELDLLARRSWFSSDGGFFCWSPTRREDVPIVPVNWPFDDKQDEPLLFRGKTLTHRDCGGAIFRRNAFGCRFLYGVLRGARGDLFVGAPVPRDLVRRVQHGSRYAHGDRVVADAKHLVSPAMQQLPSWSRYQASSDDVYVVCGAHCMPITATATLAAANAAVDNTFRAARRCVFAHGLRHMWIVKLKPGTPLDWSAIMLCMPTTFAEDVLM